MNDNLHVKCTSGFPQGFGIVLMQLLVSGLSSCLKIGPKDILIKITKRELFSDTSLRCVLTLNRL